MSKPRIQKNGKVWNVYVNNHYHAGRSTLEDAYARAEAITTYARTARMRRAIERIQASLARMEEAR